MLDPPLRPPGTAVLHCLSGTSGTSGGPPLPQLLAERVWLKGAACCAQVYMENAFHLGGELVFTVRKDAPLRMTQAQVLHAVVYIRVRIVRYSVPWKEI